MNTHLIPSPDTLSVQWGWFQILLLVTFLIHIILMNFILGGSILAVTGSFKRKHHEESMWLPTLIALTINFGVPPLLFLQVMYGQFFYTSSVLMAIPWLLVIPVLILAYYASYIFVFRKDRFYGIARISLIISTVFILYIAFMLVNNNTMLLQPERWQTYFNHPNGWNLNLSDKTVYPRYLHFITGAIAVAGLGKSGWYLFNKKAEKEYRKEQINSGMMIFFFATMVQVIVGFWFLMSLPHEIMIQFLGGNLIYTTVLLSAIALTLLALFFAIRKQILPVMIAALLLLTLMIINREFLRNAYLDGIYQPADMEVARQVSPLIVFLIVFVIGIFSLYYMIRLSLKSKPA